MKINSCRSCSNKKLTKAIDLGVQKLTGIFPKTKNEYVPSGSLSMLFCEKCKLLQLENSFNPDTMYGDNYGYTAMHSKPVAKLNPLRRKDESK